jgi:TolA-binding protein
VLLCLQTADSFSVHENPTAEDENDASSQLQELQVELAEARGKIAQIEDARQRVSNLHST